MTSPVRSSQEPLPALVAPGTAHAIREALVEPERGEFERQFSYEMAAAARTLDLTGVIRVLEVFRKLAEITHRQGADAHARMLQQVERLQSGQAVVTIPGHIHKAAIDARLGR
jgi:hypothetical protein